MSYVLILKDFIDYYLDNEKLWTQHPNLIGLDFAVHYLENQKQWPELVSEIKDLELNKAIKKRTAFLQSFKFSNNTSLENIELFREAIMSYVVDSEFNSDLDLAFRIHQKKLSFSELDEHLLKHNNYDKLSNTASACHYQWADENISYLSFERIVKLCARHIVDYRNVNQTIPKFYSVLINLGDKSNVLLSLSMLTWHKLQNGETSGLEELTKQIELNIEGEGLVHILPLKRALSVLYMAKSALGKPMSEFPQVGGSMQFYAHFSLDLPVKETFQLMAYIYTKEWHKAYEICDKINLKQLLKLEFSTGVLKLLYAEMYFVYRHLGKTDKMNEVYTLLDEVPECCFYMEPLVASMME